MINLTFHDTELSNAELMRAWRHKFNFGREQAGKILNLSPYTIKGIEYSKSRVEDEILRIALLSLLDE